MDRVTLGDCTLHRGDCLEVMPTLGAVDAIVTDPPYGLSFMGKNWDHGVPGVPFWTEALRVLKPGGHLLAFGGTRTYHRLTVAIEDAGFEIRDCISWVYGSGFPKSLDVSKAIDKAAGLPATPEARQWQGWGTALKPATEPIVVARKPLIGTVAANVLEHGTGALNIDECRVESSLEDKVNMARVVGFDKSYSNGESGISLAGSQDGSLRRICRANFDASKGRWPANLIHDGSPEVLALFPDDTARFFYCAKASKSDRGDGNQHPTVKPSALMQYLVRLVTPPGGVVLDPFMGSGTTGIAAMREGFRFVGIELDPDYHQTAARRIVTAQWGG